ncbi:unnamed protein product, partial [Cyprideis torosa]
RLPTSSTGPLPTVVSPSATPLRSLSSGDGRAAVAWLGHMAASLKQGRPRGGGRSAASPCAEEAGAPPLLPPPSRRPDKEEAHRETPSRPSSMGLGGGVVYHQQTPPPNASPFAPPSMSPTPSSRPEDLARKTADLKSYFMSHLVSHSPLLPPTSTHHHYAPPTSEGGLHLGSSHQGQLGEERRTFTGEEFDLE